MINLELRQGLLANLGDINAGDLIFVGCSGGADSLALVQCAVHVGKEKTISVGVIVIDHQIQPDSAQVAQRAATNARKLGADPVLVVNVDVEMEFASVAASSIATALVVSNLEVETFAQEVN